MQNNATEGSGFQELQLTYPSYSTWDLGQGKGLPPPVLHPSMLFKLYGGFFFKLYECVLGEKKEQLP